jgi:hypothetical protein
MCEHKLRLGHVCRATLDSRGVCHFIVIVTNCSCLEEVPGGALSMLLFKDGYADKREGVTLQSLSDSIALLCPFAIAVQ